MTQEDKLKEAKRLYQTANADQKYVLERLFPELKGSEERIRKSLSAYFAKFKPDDMWDADFSFGDIVAWLESQGETSPVLSNSSNIGKDAWNKEEQNRFAKSVPAYYIPEGFHAEIEDNRVIIKQGEQKSYASKTMNEKGDFDNGFTRMMEKEQKPTDKVEPKFHEGDWVVCEAAPKFTAFKTGDAVQISNKETLKLFLMFEDCFRLWDITKDVKDGDVLADSLGNICIYQEPSTKLMYHSYCYGNHKCFIDSGGSHKIVGTCPATKEQRDALIKAMADAGYTFDFEKKELKRIEQKPAWSEEDETTIDNLVWAIANDMIRPQDRDDYCDWLKSLKERVQPKQEWSDDDERCLIYAIHASEV